MNIRFLGTQYGGWQVDIDSIHNGDIIIGGGAGEDISFEEALLEIRNVKIVLVDPTPKSHAFLESRLSDSLVLMKNAIAKPGSKKVQMFKNKNTTHVSESAYAGHAHVSSDYHEAATVTIEELVHQFKPSLIKLDIEGSEYDVLESCLGIRQVCVEFHHRCLSEKTINDTKCLVRRYLDQGYVVIDNRNDFQEMTFLKLT